MVGYSFDGSAIADDELRTAFLPTLTAPARSEAETLHHTPRLSHLSEIEIERNDREREKEVRKRKRQTRGRRGVALPDRESLKTQRTPAIYGLQVVSPADALAFSIASQGGTSGGLVTSRRAAAVAAAAHLGPGLGDSGTPPPVADVPLLKDKRIRKERFQVYLKYPNGLGKQRLVTRRPKNVPAEATAQIAEAAETVVVPDTPPATVREKAAAPPDPVVDGQHRNYHDGQWHCANCGIPDSLAPGRRKGPRGDKSLCSLCGRFWHRYRKHRPVEYTRDYAHHQTAQAQPASKTQSGDVGSPEAADSAHSSPAPEATADVVSRQAAALGSQMALPPIPRRPQPAEEDLSALVAAAPPSPEARDPQEENAPPRSAAPSTRPGSPELPFQAVGSFSDSESDSDSNEQDKQRISAFSRARQPQGVSGEPFRAPPTASESDWMARSASDPLGPTASEKRVAQAGASLPESAPVPPVWLSDAASELRSRYPHDRFELTIRPKAPGAGPASRDTPEWRIRCSDCPGKVSARHVSPCFGGTSQLIVFLLLLCSFIRPALERRSTTLKSTSRIVRIGRQSRDDASRASISSFCNLLASGKPFASSVRVACEATRCRLAGAGRGGQESRQQALRQCERPVCRVA